MIEIKLYDDDDDDALNFFSFKPGNCPFFVTIPKKKLTNINFHDKLHLDNIVTGLVVQQHLDHSMT